MVRREFLAMLFLWMLNKHSSLCDLAWHMFEEAMNTFTMFAEVSGVAQKLVSLRSFPSGLVLNTIPKLDESFFWGKQDRVNLCVYILNH